MRWLIVADSSLARIYAYKGNLILGKNISLNLIFQLKHPESRMKEHDLVSDRPGHYKTNGTTRSAYEIKKTHKENEKENFAKKIAITMEKGRIKNSYNDIFLLAEPHFFGLLEKKLTNKVKQLISHYLLKDYGSILDKEKLLKNIKKQVTP